MPCPALPLLLSAALLASGCATITGDSTQRISIVTVDAQARPVLGMSCRVSHGPGAYLGDTPLTDLQVTRSSSPLLVECRGPGVPMARALIVPRATEVAAAQLLLPGGSSMMVIDHLTGAMYSYPRQVQLRLGADMVFDRAREPARGGTPGLVTREFDTQVRYAYQGRAEDTR